MAWPALHLLVLLALLGEALPRAASSVAGGKGAEAAVGLATLLALGALGVLAVFWTLRLWRARERAARRRAAAWCAGLALAYGASLLLPWPGFAFGGPGPESGVGFALDMLRAAAIMLRVAAAIAGLPLAWITGDGTLPAVLYVAALLGGAALTLALPPPPPPTAPAHDAPRPPV